MIFSRNTQYVFSDFEAVVSVLVKWDTFIGLSYSISSGQISDGAGPSRRICFRFRRMSGSNPRAAETIGDADDDAEAIQAIYRRHRDELCRHIRKTFGVGPPDPEDIVQSAFAKFGALPQPSAITNPRAYLFRTARNLAIDARRSLRRFDAVARNVEVLDGASHDFDAADVLESRQELARLDRALSALPQNQRTALLMHRLEELGFAEIGRRLGMTGAGARHLVLKAMTHCTAAMGDPE